ncbi:hypothetical protein DIPPA_04489 [Diplonema papillatum]|nr:hypothetical protein DIPPA_04489 [Diplonema papillatum]
MPFSWVETLEELSQQNPFSVAAPDVWRADGDADDRAAVTKALWAHRPSLASKRKAYVVVVWQKTTGADAPTSTVCTTEPDAAVSPLHAKLRLLYDSCQVDHKIPVVIVDPAVRRQHHYTYLVYVNAPWTEWKAEGKTGRV